MSRPHDTQDLYPRNRNDKAARSRAHRGSPWAWVVLLALVLAASGWWLGRDRGLQAPSSTAPAPATPANDPPHAP